MSAAGTLARLEALLARVRSRSADPRPVRATGARGPVAQVAAPAPIELLEDEDSEQPTIPPPPVAAALAPAPALELAVEIDVAVEVPAAEEESAAPLEPPAPVAEALSSQERLVVGKPAPVEAAPLEAAEPIVASPAPAAEEEIEQPPASSRRPLAPQPEERLAEMAFGAEEPRPPLHTPPPESGRLPAAPEVEFPEEDTGVHAAPPTSAVASTVTSEPTRVVLSGGEHVAAIHGGVKAFHPATFAELLDASLGL